MPSAPLSAAGCSSVPSGETIPGSGEVPQAATDKAAIVSSPLSGTSAAQFVETGELKLLDWIRK